MTFVYYTRSARHSMQARSCFGLPCRERHDGACFHCRAPDHCPIVGCIAFLRVIGWLCGSKLAVLECRCPPRRRTCPGPGGQDVAIWSGYGNSATTRLKDLLDVRRVVLLAKPTSACPFCDAVDAVDRTVDHAG